MDQLAGALFVLYLFIYFLCVVGPTRGEGFRSIKPEPIRLRVEFHSAALGRRALAGFFSSFFGFFLPDFFTRFYRVLPWTRIAVGPADRSVAVVFPARLPFICVP